MLTFPTIDPIALQLGPVAIRWYALAYLAGFILGWRYGLALIRRSPHGIAATAFDDFLSWAVLGTILGGRTGYVLFYNAPEYMAHPLEILQVWHGGMSFHGGMIGVILATLFYTRRAKISFLAFTDILACVTPIGLGLGRLANFVNGELWGRVTDVPWGMVFPRGGDLPRHPSQLYEAAAEGLLLFLILFFLSRRPKVWEKKGLLSGFFLLFYGLFRFSLEFFREPDQQLGFLFVNKIMGGTTMGQLLCVPMIGLGLYLLFRRERTAE